MDRRTFLELALSVPALGQAAAPADPPRLRPLRPGQPSRLRPRRPAASPGRSGAGRIALPDRGNRSQGHWPSSGPRVVWTRPLGEGYSAPVVENGVLYTMYGRSARQRW